VGKCPKDKIRAHLYSPSSFDRPYAHFETAKSLPRAASVDFLFVRRECSLAGTIFSSGLLLSTGYWNDSLRPKPALSGGISLARNLYAEALFEGVASVYRLRMPINDQHVALL
jgi:hypothetical protein